ncbi:hypothetical protein ACFSKU_05220 [Pontibacter silvestris]|uniref:Uncharacterized protein n=1 Tax=Pontibacter silvestris TaxID=2305183 RepID=A0ABW4WW99_9BACT|nr:hypothetical protein [Pontibacter silvestris]MCC9136938.1 hypothetical protein [Pontibacter silvestris]
MALRIRSLWGFINEALTILNIMLLAVLTGNIGRRDFKEVREKKIPAIVNILLSLLLSLGLFAAIY